MRFFDLFGFGKAGSTGSSPEASAPERPARPAALWRSLLLADILLVAGCLGLLGARIYNHLGEPSPASVPVRPAPKAPSKTTPAAATEPKKPPQPDKKESAPAAKPPKPEQPKPAKPEIKQERPEAKAAAAPQPAAAEPRKAQPTTFSYVNPAASHVTLLGSFLVRSGGKKQMFKGGKGSWDCTLYLNPGASYRYRYEVVDKHGRKTVTGWEAMEVR